MLDNPIRFGYVGCGFVAQRIHIPNFASLPDCRIMALAEVRQDLGRRVAARYNVPKVYQSHEELAADPEIEAAGVSAPYTLQSRIAEDLLRAGKHVFMEKPMAVSTSRARSMIAAGRQGKARLMVGYMKRFGTAYARAKDLTEATNFGPLTIASFKWTMGPMSEEHSSLESWLFENPIHHVDLARFFCGELDSWDARLARSAGDEFAVAVNARAAGGGVVSMQLSTTGSWEQHNERVEVQGSGASVMVDNVDTCVSRPANQPELVWRPNYTVPEPRTSSASTCGFLPELSAFAEAIATGKPAGSDFRSAARTLEAVGRLAQSVAR